MKLKELQLAVSELSAIPQFQAFKNIFQNTIDFIAKLSDDKKQNISRMTCLTILLESFYSYAIKQKFPNEIMTELLTLRKKRWAENYGVPSINFLCQFQKNISDTVSFIETVNQKQIETTELTEELPWIVKIDKSNFEKDKKQKFYFDSKSLFKPKQPEPEVNGNFVATLNKQGYMTTKLDEYSMRFVEYAAQVSQEGGKVLEIGAAFGIATLSALSKGANVYCNDLSYEHLACVEENYRQNASNDNNNSNTSKNNSSLILVPGDFTKEIDFPENYFDAVLMCRVAHFFDGLGLRDCLALINKWLKPETGKLYLINETPYLKNWASFIPVYEDRKQRGEEWPGLITDTFKYAPERAKALPPMVHWLDKETLTRVLNETGYGIENISYIDRKGQFPPDLLLDGRESVGVEAYKTVGMTK